METKEVRNQKIFTTLEALSVVVKQYNRLVQQVEDSKREGKEVNMLVATQAGGIAYALDVLGLPY